MRDANGDGTFAYPGERVAQSTGSGSREAITPSGITSAGTYQVWVLGAQVAGTDSKFDLKIDVVRGDAVQVTPPAAGLVAGQTARLQVCANLSGMEGQDGPADGVLWFGPGGAPMLFQWPVKWQRSSPPPTPTVAATETPRPSPTPIPTHTPMPTFTPEPPKGVYLPLVAKGWPGAGG
jgi:hypothetical protein